MYMYPGAEIGVAKFVMKEASQIIQNYLHCSFTNTLQLSWIKYFHKDYQVL